jgi:GNAT superfamily N-acetyltransferase
MITVANTRPKIDILAKLAYKYKLYNDDGLLQNWYHWHSYIDVIGVYRVGNSLVGSAVILKKIVDAEDNYRVNLGVWVHPTFRRKGIGSQLVKTVKKYTMQDLYAFTKGYRSQFFDGVLSCV